eukprot:CAMPEP_0194286064 /NCGR_PEP_ID=MMETSP0169-20130528/31764_1 /TAXON_ID=218684 /ORGANISM="Corethron pennatum, Strain L29A3" /LENGTH=356 /DNA_ID=CAMNT_0039032385 /DNA_START=117 /DNA_END=1184 /DNA_ORIENTATION=-
MRRSLGLAVGLPFLLAVFLPRFAPLAFRTFWTLAIASPLDPRAQEAAREIGVTAACRKNPNCGAFGGKFETERVLVVGGTRGIGRGIALELARAGAAVDIVGSSGVGKSVVAEMEAMHAEETGESRRRGNLTFRFFRADLHSIEGCRGLVDAVDAAYVPPDGEKFYHSVVFTAGQWPDTEEPLTAAGHEKGVFLSVVARFAVFDLLRRGQLLSPDCRILSVLASAQEAPPGFMLPGGTDLAFLRDFLPKAFLTNIYSTDDPPPLLGTLISESTSGDLILLELAQRHKSYSFAGTMPGFVRTDVARGHLGALNDVLFGILDWFGITFSAQECAINQLLVLRLLARDHISGPMMKKNW